MHPESLNSYFAQLALCQLGGGIAEGVLAQQISLFSSNASLQEINITTGVCVPSLLWCLSRLMNLPILQIWNGCSAACDLLIAISMTYSVSFFFLYVFLYFLNCGVLAFQTEIGLETNSTHGPETHAADHWDRDFDWSESLPLSAIRP